MRCWLVVCWIVIGWGMAPGLQGLDSPRPVLVLDSHDQPWTAWVERQGAVTVGRVAHWNGAAWNAAGGPLNRGGRSVAEVSLTLAPDGTPWAAWAEGPADKAGVNDRSGLLHAARWTGQAWEEPAPSPLQSASAVPERPQIQVDSAGHPWLLWSEFLPDVRAESVFLASLTDKTWSLVDPGSLTTGADSSSRARDLALTADNRPFLAFSQMIDHHSYQVFAGSWDGQRWVALGGALNLNPEAYAGFPSVAVDAQGRPTVAFLQASDGFKLVVRRWTGSAWELLGTPGSLGVRNPKLALSLGAPVLAAVERIVGITVRQRSNAGWVDLGATISTPGAFVETLDLAVDSQGDPWIFWAEDDAQGQRLRLSHWMGNHWEPVTPPPFSQK